MTDTSSTEDMSSERTEFTAAANSIMNKIQFTPGIISKEGKIIPYSQFISVISGKFGFVTSMANLMVKYRNGTDTASDWLDASADKDISLFLADGDGDDSGVSKVVTPLATAYNSPESLRSTAGY